MKIDKGGQTLPISVHEMAPERAFSVSQKWPKYAKMTPNDLLTLKMVFTEETAEENWTKHSFSFLKFIIFVDLEGKTNSTVIMLIIPYNLTVQPFSETLHSAGQWKMSYTKKTKLIRIFLVGLEKGWKNNFLSTKPLFIPPCLQCSFNLLFNVHTSIFPFLFILVIFFRRPKKF